MADNVIDLTAFRKRKRTEEPSPNTPHAAIVSDRAHYRLHNDLTLEIFTGPGVEKRPATRDEITLMRHINFMEETVAHLVDKYAPHMLYDDYLTTPYVDWDKVAELNGANAKAWHEAYQDHPEVILSRLVHVMVRQARKEMLHIAYSNRLGLAISDEIRHGKILRAEESPLMLYIGTPEDLADHGIAAHFKAIKPSSKLGATVGGSFKMPFLSDSRRSQFVARLMSIRDMEGVRGYLTSMSQATGGTVTFS